MDTKPQSPEHHIHETLENIKRIAAASSPESPATNKMMHLTAFLSSKLSEQGAASAKRNERTSKYTLCVCAFTLVIAVLQVVIALLKW